MKKLVITLLALVAIVTAADAQGMSKEQREKTMYNLIIRMRPVGTQYAITTTPVTYNEYWAATGKKAHSAGTSVTNAAKVSKAQAEDMVKTINAETQGVLKFSIATSAQISESSKKVGLHGEMGPQNTQTQGFFLVLPYSQWKMYKETE
jgi:hypothetical protein